MVFIWSFFDGLGHGVLAYYYKVLLLNYMVEDVLSYYVCIKLNSRFLKFQLYL